jgi:hypothetical protein
MTDKANEVTISITLPRDRAWAFAEVIKRLQRRNIGPADLDLANPHQPDEQSEAEQAIDQIQRALAQAGFEPR